MSSTEWRPGDDHESETDLKFGDALAELAIEDAPDIDPRRGYTRVPRERVSLFVDSNIFIGIVTGDTDRSDIARELLNSDRDFHSSIYNIIGS